MNNEILEIRIALLAVGDKITIISDPSSYTLKIESIDDNNLVLWSSLLCKGDKMILSKDKLELSNTEYLTASINDIILLQHDELWSPPLMKHKKWFKCR